MEHPHIVDQRYSVYSYIILSWRHLINTVQLL